MCSSDLPPGLGRAALRALVESLARSKGALLGPIDRVAVRLVPGAGRAVTPGIAVEPVEAVDPVEAAAPPAPTPERRRPRRAREAVQMTLLP